jgi:PAS domain S-box-containing protein
MCTLRSPLHILHLEDDSNDFKLIKSTLLSEKIDCKIVHVSTGADFIKALENDEFDIILADHSLPDFDGLSALTLARKKYPDIPFIFVSGTIRETLAIETMKSGITDYVLKDNLPRLVPSIERALREAEESKKCKRAEETMRESEANLFAIVENTHDLIWSVDREYRLITANSAFHRTIAVALGREIACGEGMLLDVFPSNVLQPWQKWYDRALRGESYVQEMAFTDTNGVKRVWETAFNAITDPQVGIVGVTCFGRDITERKQAEEEIHKLNEELEQRVIERTSQLEAANSELESFSYSVSHDLRAPLRSINGFSKILTEDYMDKLDDEGKRLLNIIQDNTEKMENLIDDLLALSRIGRKDIVLSDIDMYKLAKEVFNEVKAINLERKIQFNIQPLPPARGDLGMIQQVFFNLLSNAIKFTKTKEVAVVEVGGYDEGLKNVYYVKDNGVGFNMKYANQLFRAFQRLHSEEEFEGTGIGLALVKRIVNRHNGQIWAEGKENEGATFYFTLAKNLTKTED